MIRMIRRTVKYSRVLWQIVMVRHTDGWWASPAQHALTSLTRFAYANLHAPRYRRIHSRAAAVLKYREIVHAPHMNAVSVVSANRAEDARFGLAQWRKHIQRVMPNVIETVSIHGNIITEAPDTPTMDILTEVITTSGFNNLGFYWSEESQITGGQMVLTKSERKAWFETREQSRFDLVRDTIENIADLERNGVGATEREIPHEAYRQVNRYLKTAAPGTTVVAVSLPTDELGFCDASLCEWLPFFARMRKRYPRVAFCPLEPTTLGKTYRERFDQAGVFPFRARGHSELDALAMARNADVFLGKLSPYGLLAIGARKPGLFLDPASGDHHEPDHLQWFLRSETAGNPEQILVQVLDALGAAKSGIEPDIFEADETRKTGPDVTSRSNVVPLRQPQKSSPWYKPPGERSTVTLYVDVFGHCNLRCPSCPVGNWNQADSKTFSSGLIDETTLVEILEKAIAETNVSSVGLFNWTEPLLNPRTPELIEIVRSYGLSCSISSNLNQLRDPERLLSSGLDWLRVSLSGFHQENYVKGHKGGDIEKVKANMRRLAEARDATGASTDIEVFYHKYLDNVPDEALMKAYAEELGFRFVSAWAYLMPVEKMLTVGGKTEMGATLTDGDRALIDRLALAPEKALEITRKTHTTTCNLYDFLTIDVRGDLYLCCASSGAPKNKLGSYLKMGIDEIREKQRTHNLCGPCMELGLPTLYGHSDERFDAIGESELKKYQAENPQDENGPTHHETLPA